MCISDSSCASVSTANKETIFTRSCTSRDGNNMLTCASRVYSLSTNNVIARHTTPNDGVLSHLSRTAAKTRAILADTYICNSTQPEQTFTKRMVL